MKFNASNKPNTCLYCGRKLIQNYTYTYRGLSEEEQKEYNKLIYKFHEHNSDLRLQRDNGDITLDEFEKRDRKLRNTFCKSVVKSKGAKLNIVAKRVDESHPTGRYGLSGEGHFDTLNCAARFGELAARNGTLFEPVNR